MFKPLRVMLMIACLLMIIFATKPGTAVVFEGAALITTLLLPVLAPLIFFGMLLDSLMLLVFMSEYTGAKRTEYQVTFAVTIALVCVLVWRWYAYFFAV